MYGELGMHGGHAGFGASAFGTFASAGFAMPWFGSAAADTSVNTSIQMQNAAVGAGVSAFDVAPPPAGVAPATLAPVAPITSSQSSIGSIFSTHVKSIASRARSRLRAFSNVAQVGAADMTMLLGDRMDIVSFATADMITALGTGTLQTSAMMMGGVGGGGSEEKVRLPIIDRRGAGGEDIHVIMPEGMIIGTPVGNGRMLRDYNDKAIEALFAAFVRDFLDGDVERFNTKTTQWPITRGWTFHQGDMTFQKSLKTIIEAYAQNNGFENSSDAVNVIKPIIARLLAEDTVGESTEVTQALEHVDGVIDSIKILARKVDRLSAEVGEKQQRIEGLEAELAVRPTRDQYDALNAEKDEALADLQAARQELIDAAENFESEKMALEARIQDLEGSDGSKAAEIGALQGQLSEILDNKERVTGLESEIDDLGRRLGDANAEIAGLKDRQERVVSVLDEVLDGPLAGLAALQSPLVARIREMLLGAKGLLTGVTTEDESAEAVGRSAVDGAAQAADISPLPSGAGALMSDVIPDEAIDDDTPIARMFPSVFESIIGSLDEAGVRQILRLRKKDRTLVNTLLWTLETHEVGYPGITNLLLNAIDTLSDKGEIGYAKLDEYLARLNRLNPDHENYGIVHELVRLASLVEAGKPIHKLGREFSGPGNAGIEYDGWFYNSDRRELYLPARGRRLRHVLDADGYAQSTRTVYEVKSMLNGMNETVVELIGEMTRRSAARISVEASDHEAKYAKGFYNQIKKLGAAVQSGVILNVELHLTTTDDLPDTLINFIQRTIPNVKIFIYDSMFSSFEEAYEVPENQRFRWVQSTSSTRSRYELVGGMGTEALWGEDAMPAVEVVAEKGAGVASLVTADGSAEEAPLLEKIAMPASIEVPPSSPVPVVEEVESAADAAVSPAVTLPAGKVVIVQLDSTYDSLNAVLGVGVVPESLLTEEFVPNGTVDRVSEIAKEFNARIERVRESIGTLVSRARQIRPYTKKLIDRQRALKLIPSDVADRRAYAEELVALNDEIGFLEELAGQWQGAVERFNAISMKIPEGEVVQEYIPQLIEVGVMVALLNDEDSGDIVEMNLVLIEKLEALNVQLDKLARSHGEKENVHPGRNLTEYIQSEVRVRTEEHAELIEALRSNSRNLDDEIEGFDTLRTFISDLEKLLGDVEAELPSLSTSDEDGWLYRFDTIDQLLNLVWELVDKVEAVHPKIFGGDAEIHVDVMGEWVELLEYSEFLQTSAGMDHSSVAMLREALQSSISSADLIIVEMTEPEPVSIDQRRDIVRTMAIESLVPEVRSAREIEYHHASMIANAFIDALSDATIISITDVPVLDLPAEHADRKAAFTVLGKTFKDWFDANRHVLNPAFFDNGTQGTGQGTGKPWDGIAEKDVMSLLDSLFTESGLKKYPNWNVDKHHLVRKHHMITVLSKLMDELSSLEGDGARAVSADIYKFINDNCSANAGGPFPLVRLKGELFDLTRRYIWVLRNSKL